MQAILGQKVEQTQKFLENGKRIPVTRVAVSGNVVIAVRTPEKNGYHAMQLGFGTRKKGNRALIGHVKGAKLTAAPQILKEVRLADADSLSVGDMLQATAMFAPGDIIDVIGTSKGKGYAGVVKRHHFKGGPRTHGQSDRERAPGSIGQTTTPGRVYPGKRMAGRMGTDTVTVRNLQIVDVNDHEVLIKGLVPGNLNSIIMIEKAGSDKKFVPLYASSLPPKQAATASDDQNSQQTEKNDETNGAEGTGETQETKVEKAEEELEKDEEKVNKAEKVEEAIEEKK